MRSLAAILAVALMACRDASAFAPPSSSLRLVSTRGRVTTPNMVYIPDGLSAAEWKKIQAEEKKKQENLGRVGPNRFKSRSFQAWQESGAGHLFPVDPKKVKSGEIPMDKVPYMQRGGAWDDSDLATKKAKEDMAKKKGAVFNNITSKKVAPKKWSATDKAYAQGGYKKEQSVSIFGGTSLPWVAPSTKGRGPAKPAASKPTAAVQRKGARPGTSVPMSAAVKRRIEKEAADERKRQEQLKTQLNGEKKGLFGLW